VRELHVAPELLEAGLILTDLATAAREHEDLVRAHLGTAAGPDAGKFEALNAALFGGGIFLHVPRDLQVQEPIYFTQRGARDLSGLFPRVLIVAAGGSEVTVIDEYANEGSPRLLANAVVEGIAEANSRLSYFNIQRWGARTRSHANQRFLVNRDASVTTVNIGLGGLYSKADLGNVLNGLNAQAEMIGVMFGGDRQHFDNHTEHVHRAGHSHSDMDFKVVLEDHARSVYTGLIRIDLEARNSEAYQENRNLMLDPTCQAESIPELEILNEDVRCTHGATVGPIDEEQVYYLQTRGLTETEAEHLIVEGFFGPALDRIEEPALRDRLWGYIEEKLEDRRS
jgi:Fe-S cluster assembly protein SufD